jgi:hypothetical protein
MSPLPLGERGVCGLRRGRSPSASEALDGREWPARRHFAARIRAINASFSAHNPLIHP